MRHMKGPTTRELREWAMAGGAGGTRMCPSSSEPDHPKGTNDVRRDPPPAGPGPPAAAARRGSRLSPGPRRPEARRSVEYDGAVPADDRRPAAARRVDGVRPHDDRDN